MPRFFSYSYYDRCPVNYDRFDFSIAKESKSVLFMEFFIAYDLNDIELGNSCYRSYDFSIGLNISKESKSVLFKWNSFYCLRRRKEK